MISGRHKCIFLHPNKCGGKTIEKLVFDVGCEIGSSDHRFNNEYRETYGDEVVDSYFKFMFCRNPWDRMVSMYFKRVQLNNKKMPSFKTFLKNVDTNSCLKR